MGWRLEADSAFQRGKESCKKYREPFHVGSYEDIDSSYECMLPYSSGIHCNKLYALQGFHYWWSYKDICDICSNPLRDNKTILVVENVKDVIAFERVGSFKGVYHVLNGSISPINGIGPDELNIESLKERVKNGSINEVIVATSATVEGEATALYLKRILEDFTTVSRIAYGMPVGSSIEYNDETTILKALEGRKKY